MRAVGPSPPPHTLSPRRRGALGALAACAVTALTVLTGLCPAAVADETGATAAELDRFAERYVERTGLPGATVAVTKGQEVVLTAGYGHAGDGEALTARSPMRIASLSKSFTALAVMQLVEAGEVELNRPVRRYLPGFRIDDPRGARITVRQLLDQSSGMSDRTFPDASRPEQPDSLKEAVAQLRTAGLAAEPGTDWNYHNPNYHVAARLVEVVSGQSFGTYLRRKVFAPAGMDDTVAAEAAGTPAPDSLADGHIRAYGMNIPMPEPDHFSAGSGGIVSTAEDMAKWLILQQSGGRAANRERVVSAGSVAEMHTPSANEGRYALGWMRRVPDGADRARQPQIWHGGSLSTYSAYQFLVPDTGYGVAVLYNSGITLTEEDLWGLADGLLALTEGRTPPQGGSSLWKIDAVFGALTAATAALGIRGLLRSGTWATRRRRRPMWRAAVRLLPYSFPPALLAVFQPGVDFLMGGRDATWLQRFYAVPAELSFLGIAALTCLAVVAARIAALVRAARRSAHATSAQREAADPSHST
ncbi:serine hydrolase domain-containing protein [Streptomonospora litoralis]|uniref:D-alanyl-D-alanine carboxypeptidase n=1 Tax=Streptomonospora litoralis TaxID=2498135 RepID=A0A4P6Q6U0_9ACTN|nr:serine hydrolase domain-containing protein [Streptomonospora litoralis]QBI56498.1 D-alanyl-D-alanine carboxypeptidase precursor [Streptomonospora litoralis]